HQYAAVFVDYYHYHSHLHSFPTRRSSDLGRAGCPHAARPRSGPRRGYNEAMKTLAILVGGGPAPGINAVIAAAPRFRASIVAARSEEHTSELQSRVDLVCRLLLEKTKQTS